MSQNDNRLTILISFWKFLKNGPRAGQSFLDPIMERSIEWMIQA